MQDMSHGSVPFDFGDVGSRFAYFGYGQGKDERAKEGIWCRWEVSRMEMVDRSYFLWFGGWRWVGLVGEMLREGGG